MLNSVCLTSRGNDKLHKRERDGFSETVTIDPRKKTCEGEGEREVDSQTEGQKKEGKKRRRVCENHIWHKG